MQRLPTQVQIRIALLRSTRWIFFFPPVENPSPACATPKSHARGIRSPAACRRDCGYIEVKNAKMFVSYASYVSRDFSRVFAMQKMSCLRYHDDFRMRYSFREPLSAIKRSHLIPTTPDEECRLLYVGRVGGEVFA